MAFLRAATVAALACVAGIAAGCTTNDGTAVPASRTVETTVVALTESSVADEPPAASTPSAHGYRPTLVRTDGRRASTTYDVQLPRIDGGESAVRDRFNSGMRAALDDVVTGLTDTTVSDGSLADDERSRVTTITDDVVAGTAIFTTDAQGAAHPNNHVATIAIDAHTAAPILLDDVFLDTDSAAAELAAAVARIDPRVDPVYPDIDNFLNWVPLANGFHTYVPVVHALGDWLPVTVPWDEISALLRPGMADQLSG
ncbi:hypothetical protein VX037_19135 [Gordonia sp. Z-3]|uniref:hypothetical protein n=1 Tax=Gordonia sp. Z-3 TaxID=3115408 RepID=UPI002E28862B|nr:hypothetical protein [Gordonia sp. Z-3]MED5803143.1 hypothetical protein [Gordonia sp. Z-3]